MKIYSALFNDFSHLQCFGDTEVVSSPEDFNTEKGILILHGGEDISPGLYKQSPSSYTSAKPWPSQRDKLEQELTEAAIKKGYGIFGICRGAQLLTALAGGSLIQDVTGHGQYHFIRTNKDAHFFVTSAHHQMCNPKDTEHELIAWSEVRRSEHYISEKDKKLDMDKEPELIFYPKMKALACQPHPEWMKNTTPFVQYLLKLIEEKLT